MHRGDINKADDIVISGVAFGEARAYRRHSDDDRAFRDTVVAFKILMEGYLDPCAVASCVESSSRILKTRGGAMCGPLSGTRGGRIRPGTRTSCR